MIIIVLRLVVLLLWLPAQGVALLAGGWGLLGFQMGDPGSGVLGIVVFLLPAVVAGGALWYSFAAAPPRAAFALVGASLLLMLVVLPAWLAKH